MGEYPFSGCIAIESIVISIVLMDFHGVLTNHEWENIMGKHSTVRMVPVLSPRQAADVLGGFQLIPSEHPEFDASFPNLLDGIGDSILHWEFWIFIPQIMVFPCLSIGFKLQIMLWIIGFNPQTHPQVRNNKQKALVFWAPEVYLRWLWHQPAPMISQQFPPCSLAFELPTGNPADTRISELQFFSSVLRQLKQGSFETQSQPFAKKKKNSCRCHDFRCLGTRSLTRTPWFDSWWMLMWGKKTKQSSSAS